MSERYDIVVAGGGIVGGVFANLAAREGLRVAVVDPGAPPRLRADTPTGARVVALSRASERLLQRAGAWEDIPPARRGAYERMRIWDATGTAAAADTLVFDCADVGEPNLGHIVENDAVVAAASSAARRNGVTWLAGQAVASIERRANDVRVATSQGTRLGARLLVAADGARSPCRDLVGVEVAAGHYEQEAVVCHLDTERPHASTAWQRFLPSGPIALLPLADGRVSLVWSTGVAEARRLLGLGEDEFLAAVTGATDGVLGAMTACTRRHTFPLNWLHAREYCRSRFVLIGDAAHCVHPLAGQGVNLGLLDAASLMQVLDEAADARRDIGDRGVLRRYARWRRSENALMLASFTGLNRLFGSDDALLARLRRGGMGAVNALAPIRRELVLRAMGVAGDVPAAVRATGDEL